jgi:hypothetical protein
MTGMALLRIRFLAASHRLFSHLLSWLFHIGRGWQGRPHVHPEYREYWRHLEPIRRFTTAALADSSPPLPPAQVGIYFSSVVILTIETEIARGLLADGLELGPQNLTPSGTHPLLCMFGYQRDVRPPFPFPGMDYLEFIAALPWVHWRQASNSCGRPFVFMPRLYLNRFLPTILGWICGYAKQLARLHMKETFYHVRNLFTPDPLAEGRFMRKGEPGPPSAFKFFPPIQEVFEQRFIGKSLLGTFVCTDFRFDFKEARMQAIDADLDIKEECVQGLPALLYSVKGIDQHPLGAFQLHVRWHLTPPFDCSLLEAGEW